MSDTESSGLVRISYGHGGWFRAEWPNVRAVTYVRVELVGGIPRAVETYADGRGGPVGDAALGVRELGKLVQVAMRGKSGWLESSRSVPGPDLSTLASSYGTTWGPGMYARRKCDCCGGPLRRRTGEGVDRERATDDWVALSWFAQRPDSGIPRPQIRTRKLDVRMPHEPPPLEAPERLDDAFFKRVAEHYAWAALTGKRYAPMLAKQAQVSTRTAQNWVLKARAKGFIPPANRKKASDGQ